MKRLIVHAVAVLALCTAPAFALAPYRYSCLPASAQPEGGSNVTVLIHNPQPADEATIAVAIRSRGGNDLTASLGVPTSFTLEANRTTGRPDRSVSWTQPIYNPPIWSDANAGLIPLTVTITSDVPVNVTVLEPSQDFTSSARTCVLTQTQVP